MFLNAPKKRTICAFAVVVLTDGAVYGPALEPAASPETSIGRTVPITPVYRMMPPDAPFVPASIFVFAVQALLVWNVQVCDRALVATDARRQKVSWRILSSRVFLRIEVHPVGAQMTVFVIASVMTI